MNFEQYYDKIKNVLKMPYGTLAKNVWRYQIWLAPRLHKVCAWIYNRLNYMNTTFHDPNLSRANFRKSGWVVPPWVVVDQKNLRQMGLKYIFKRWKTESSNKVYAKIKEDFLSPYSHQILYFVMTFIYSKNSKRYTFISPVFLWNKQAQF